MQMEYRKSIALSLACSLVVLAPGVEPYRLLAGVTGNVPKSVGSQPVSTSGKVISGGNSSDISLEISDVGSLELQSNLPGAQNIVIPQGNNVIVPAAAKALSNPNPTLRTATPDAIIQSIPSPNGVLSDRAAISAPTAADVKNAGPTTKRAVQAVSNIAQTPEIKQIHTGKGLTAALGALFHRRNSPGASNVSPVGTTKAAQFAPSKILLQRPDLAVNAADDAKNAASPNAIEPALNAASPSVGKKAAPVKNPKFSKAPWDWFKHHGKKAFFAIADPKVLTMGVIVFIGGLTIAQVAQEFYGQSMPPLIKVAFGSFSVYASMTIFRIVGRTIGNAVGGVLPEIYGDKKTYLAAEIGRALSVGVLALGLLTGMITAGPVGYGIFAALMAANGLFTGMTVTAHASIARKLVGKDQRLLEGFYNIYQFITEFAGIGAPILAGFIMASTGTFTWTLGAYPLILGAAILFFWKFLRIPGDSGGTAAQKQITAAPGTAGKVKKALEKLTPEPTEKKTAGAALKLVWSRFLDGKRVVMGNKVLRTAAFSDAGFLMLNLFLYSAIAPAFGFFIVGQTMDPGLILNSTGAMTDAAATAAGQIQAWTVGLYSAGALIGTVFNMWGNKRLTKRVKAGQLTREDAIVSAKRSTLRWMTLGGLSLIAFLPMIGTNLTLAYAGIFTFGILSVVPMLKLKGLIGSLTPDKDIGPVNGFISMATGVMASMAVIGFGQIFDVFTTAVSTPSQMAFIVMSAVLGSWGAMLIGGKVLLARQLNLPTWKNHKSDPVLPKGLGWLSILPAGLLRIAFSPERNELKKLDKNLKRLGLPPVKKKTDNKPVSQDRPTIVWYAPASVYKLAEAQEGGRQASEDYHLVLDPSWVKTRVDPDGTQTDFVMKAVKFDSDGKQATIVTYKHPRRVRFEADYFTPGSNDRTDGLSMKRQASHPTSSSPELEAVTNDKYLTGSMIAYESRGGEQAVPIRLNLLLKDHPHFENSKTTAEGMRVLSQYMHAMPEEKAALRQKVKDHLEANADILGDEVVVKPSGPQWHSSRGVQFFQTNRIDDIVDHIIALKNDPMMTADGSVLIDQRIDSPPLYFDVKPTQTRAPPSVDDGVRTSVADRMDGDVELTIPGREGMGWSDKNHLKKDFNLRLFAQRTPWGGTTVSGVFVRAGTYGKPVVAEPGGASDNTKAKLEDAAVIMSYDDVLWALKEQHGYTDEQLNELKEKMDLLAKKTLTALWANEDAMRERGELPQGARTDFIGLDVMLHRKGNKLIPMVIEVNDMDSGGQMQLDKFHPEDPGLHSRARIQNAIQEARRDALRGKRIVVVGAGYHGKEFIFQRAKELGIKIVLVDFKDSWAEKYADTYIPVDMTDRDEVLKVVQKKIKDEGLEEKLDGIMGFWEDDVPTMAKLGEVLGLKTFSYRSAIIAHNKAATRAILKAKGIEDTKSAMVTNESQLETAIKKVGFPAIMKPAGGAAAKFVYIVNNAAEARAIYPEIVRLVALEQPSDPSFNPADGVIFDEYLDGDEVDIDIAMVDGQSLFRPSVTDNWPTKKGRFIATGSNLPSRLTKEVRQTLANHAIKTAQAIGLTDGIFHIEAKFTSKGEPRIIEANARLGGTYVAQWVKAVWGIDLVEEAFHIAAGVPGKPFKSRQPLLHLDGMFGFPEKTGIISEIRGVETIRDDKGLFEFRAFMGEGDIVISQEDGGNDRVGMLTGKGRSADEARDNRLRLSAKVDVVVEAENAAAPTRGSPGNPDAPEGSDDWLLSRINPSPRGLNFAKFLPGEWKPEYETRVQKLGADVIDIRHPSSDQVASLSEADGWNLKPRWVRWVRKSLAGQEEYLAAMPTKKRGKMKKRFDKINRAIDEGNISVESKRLTQKDFEEWYPLYKEFVVGKAGGTERVNPEWARKQLESGNIEWHGVWYRDSEGKMIGGFIMAPLESKGYVSAGYAAYNKQASSLELSYFMNLKVMELAKAKGLDLVSSGADTNLYGFDYSLGLLGFKAQIGMIPHPQESFSLFKVLSPEKLGGDTNYQDKRPGYFYFRLKRDSEFVKRYLSLSDEQRASVEGYEIMGGAFFSDEADEASAMLEGVQYYYDDVKLPSLQGVETVRIPLAGKS
ncbi:MAG: hypothetical protein COB53_08380 [Elusimicrobia bacterium]|nr:MAG: hypothetical protein COB53_08380 [Elusimicrobiota bacterium]